VSFQVRTCQQVALHAVWKSLHTPLKLLNESLLAYGVRYGNLSLILSLARPRNPSLGTKNPEHSLLLFSSRRPCLFEKGMKLQLKTPMAVAPENHATPGPIKTSDPSLMLARS